MNTIKIKSTIDVIKSISLIASLKEKNTQPVTEAIPFIYGSWH